MKEYNPNGGSKLKLKLVTDSKVYKVTIGSKEARECNHFTVKFEL